MSKILLILVFIIASSTTGWGATYYVDQGHGSASDSNAGTSEAAPWLTLKKATQTAVAGDTVIVKEGVYVDSSPSSGWPYEAFQPVHSGTAGNPITYRSEPRGAAVVRRANKNYLAWGTNDRDYLIIDGFKIEGGVRLSYANYCIVRNNELVWGWYPPDDTSLNWGIAIHVESSDNLVTNNYVHDMESSGNNLHNTAQFMLYGGPGDGTDNNIFEYNTAIVSGTVAPCAFNSKGGNMSSNTWRYNFAKMTSQAGTSGGDEFFAFQVMGATDGGQPVEDNIIHNNVAVGFSNGVQMYKDAVRTSIYNNTFYDIHFPIWAGLNTNNTSSVFNNILHSDVRQYYFGEYSSPTYTYATLMSYCDYNAYIGPYTHIARTWDFAAWKSQYASFDANSVTTDPGFTNASGGLSAATDFKRLAYVANGRGGAYPSVMGAYITGHEIIGYSANVGLGGRLSGSLSGGGVMR